MDKIRVSTVDNVVLERYVTPPPDAADGRPKKERLTGQLHLVQHHLFFSPSASSSTSIQEEIWIPYPAINLLTRLPQSIDGLYPLRLRTRTFESYLLFFEKDREGGAEDVWLSIKDCAVATSVEQLYAFYYRLPSAPSSSPTLKVTSQPPLHTSSPLSSSPPRPATPIASTSTQPTNGWDAFNPRSEFTRQGVGVRTKAWRFTDINKDYSFCPTYPAKMVVPSRISDNVLSYAGRYRSKARIPALTYLHWANHASMTRSAQPLVGLKNSRSAQDEKLVECIFSTHLSAESAYVQASQSNDPLSPTATTQTLPPVYGATTTNLIIDARPTANAVAQVALGAGSENMDNYKTGKKGYLGIDNIHVMRNSLKTIDEAIKEAEETGGSLDRIMLRKSNWLRHISTILDGALAIIKNIHLNASHVLIHCSDGWDRTAQLSALSQVCLDPYFRTMDGFRVLVEKDWLAFGHKFLDRSGHLSSEKLFTVADAPDDESDDELGGAQKAAQAFFASMQKQFSGNSHLKEISPVFHQFLDCIWQIHRQFPDRFEFNEEFLIDMHYHLYACQLGTFLFNTEQQRRMTRPPQGDSEGGAYIDRTVAAWDYFAQTNPTSYINESYDPTLDARDSRKPNADQGVLLLDPKDVKFWWKLFKRGDEEMNGSKIALQQAQGAQLLEVGAGQVDPVSMESAVLVGDGLGPLEVPYAVRRTPSPGVVSTRDLNAGPSSSSVPKSTSFNGDPSEFPSTGMSKSPTAPSARGGWNWSQLSSGAFNALQKGARDIGKIGQEAMQQLRAESQGDGEVWTKTEDRGSGIAAGGLREGDAGQGFAVRLPSEANPWAARPATVDEPSTEPDVDGAVPVAAALPKTAARPAQARQESIGTNPWGGSRSSPSLSDLTLHADKHPIKKLTPNGQALETISKAPAGPVVEDPMTAAALGGDTKAWDPLGAS